MPLWLVLLYIVGIAIVVVIVAIAVFYVALFLGIAFGFVSGARAIGHSFRRVAPEIDLKHEIRIAKKKDAEDDRQRKRRRKRRFWNLIYRDDT